MTHIGPSRLELERNCWLATVRPDGRAHLSPIWFVWLDGAFWMCCDPRAVKARNIVVNDSVSVSLESGNDPVVAEGRAVLHERPFPATVAAAFLAKFEWDISGDTPDPDGDYGTLIEVRPTRWLMGGPE